MNGKAAVLDALLDRTSVHPRLVSEPAPTSADLDVIFRAAVAAPDHKALRPWRFLIIEGKGLHALGELFRQAHLERDPSASEDELQISADKALRAPMVIAVYAHLRDEPKVPRDEQILSCGCAMQQMILAADALGYGSAILSGPNMHSEAVHRGLELASNEVLTGLIYIGTPRQEPRFQKPRPEASQFVRHWPANT